MIKGKTIIELTDVNTGEVERHEDNNMVTNALNKIFETLWHMKAGETIYSSLSPFYEVLLGGLLLFDNTIEEHEDTLFAPANAGLVGCGVCNEVNGTVGTVRGNFNKTESEIDLIHRSVKYVYDFTTAQGNGTIACACLTSKSGGYTSYGSNDAVTLGTSNVQLSLTTFIKNMVYTDKYYTGANSTDKSLNIKIGEDEYIFAIDINNDVVYYFKANSATSISIVKRKAYIKGLSVFDTPYSVKDLIEEIQLDPLTTGLLGGNFNYNFSKEENALFITSYDSSVYKESAIRITKIEFGTWRYEEFEILNKTGERLNTYYSNFFVYQGYLYAIGDESRKNIYKINITDSTDVIKMEFNTGGITITNYTAALVINGRLFYEHASSYDSKDKVIIVNTEKDTVQSAEPAMIKPSSISYGTYTPVIGDNFYWYLSQKRTGFFTIPSFYLVTINNLSTPVTKTADKTMKVTYVIQEVDE